MTQIIDAEAVENVVVAPQAAPPAYLPSKILDGAAREDALAMMARLISHTKNKTTDQAEATFQEPVENYLDEELFASEIELIFKRIPLPLALSCELPEKNNHKAIEVVGVPVVITRDSQGQVHAMLNVCRHRGALICSAGLGTSRALTCPYHNWSYGMDGQLKGLYGESTFGDFDKSERNMIKLPCVEKHGVIFVCLTPELEIDIDSWLGDFAPILESLKLADCHLFSTRMMPGPNWKVAIEGYLEGYHFAALHKDTVFKTNLSNTATFDGHGAHERVAFALREIENHLDDPEDTWDPTANVGTINWLFPGFSIAGGWRQRMAVAFPLPTTKVTESLTEQRILVRTPITNDEREQHELAVMRDWFYDVTYDEDYITGFGVQKGVAVTGGKTQIFGRNEPGVQYVHRTINRLMREGAEAVHGGDLSKAVLPRVITN
jgi:phenylpropionate dioxygenase-like ring-hydroxylating dioxygenase large terminal subunit